MSKGRIIAWPIGLLCGSQAIRSDFSLNIQALFGFPAIALLMYASGLIWDKKK